MTKTLTEQWREGELNEGWYYVVSERDDEIRMLYFEGDYFLDTDVPLDNDDIKEVLSPVPSYDEYNDLIQQNVNQESAIETYVERIIELEKKLEIATKALKKYAESDNWFEEDIHGEVWSFQKESKYPWRIGFKALKEMEGIK